MNQSTDERLIDEHEIRTALRPWRPDRQSFADGVRNRVEVAVKQRSDAHWNDSASAERSTTKRMASHCRFFHSDSFARTKF